MGHVCRKVVCASGQRVGLARLRIKPVQVLASRNAALSRRARGISAEVVQGAFGGRDDSGLHCPRARSGDCTTPGLACWMHGLRVEIAAASLGAASLMLGMLLNPCPCRSALPPPADVATRVETPGSRYNVSGAVTSSYMLQVAASPSLPSSFPTLPELEMPKYQELSLPNGMTVFLIEDHEVPLVKGTMLIRGGAQADPPNKVGLASIVAFVQRSGGTRASPGQQLDAALEDMGAAVEVQAGLKTTAFNFSCLAEDTSAVLRLVDQIIREPEMPESKLEQARASGLNSIRHRYDSASAVPRRKMQELLYGRDSPLARQTSVDGLTSIRMQDLTDFMRKWQRPDNAVLGLVGDFDSESVKLLVSDVFNDWEPQFGEPPVPPSLPMLEDESLALNAASGLSGRLYLVDKPGESEASVLLAEPGISLEDPDAPALDVLDDILNGFGGRLFDEVRSKDGLTYSVYGGWETPPSYRGLFTAGGNTRKPAELITAIQGVMKHVLSDEPVTKEEVDIAKSSAGNSFVFNFASKQQHLSRILVYHVLGLPQDYFIEYQRRLARVTAEDVQQACKRHLHPGEQVIVVAGDARMIEGQLSEIPSIRALLPLPLTDDADEQRGVD